jgi:hypothetical protein
MRHIGRQGDTVRGQFSRWCGIFYQFSDSTYIRDIAAKAQGTQKYFKNENN